MAVRKWRGLRLQGRRGWGCRLRICGGGGRVQVAGSSAAAQARRCASRQCRSGCARLSGERGGISMRPSGEGGKEISERPAGEGRGGIAQLAPSLVSVSGEMQRERTRKGNASQI